MTVSAWGFVFFFCSLVWVGTLVGAVTLRAVFCRRVRGKERRCGTDAAEHTLSV